MTTFLSLIEDKRLYTDRCNGYIDYRLEIYVKQIKKLRLELIRQLRQHLSILNVIQG